MSLKRFLGPLVGLAVSLVFLLIAFYRVDFSTIGEGLRKADYRFVAASAVLTLSSYVFRSLRWSRLLKPQKKIMLARIFPVLLIGFALNNFFPGRPGEFARAIALGSREGLPKSSALATVVLERVADGLTLITILASISLGIQVPVWGREVERVSVAIFTAGLVILLVLILREPLAIRTFNRLIRFFPETVGERLTGIFSAFILGLHSLRSIRDLSIIFLLSVAVWLCEAGHYFLILTAFGLFDDLPLRGLASTFTMVIVNLGISIPAAPGGVGPFEAAGVLALSVLGLGREASLPPLLTAHGVQYVLVSFLGIVFMGLSGLRLTRVLGQSRSENGLEK